MAAVPAEAHTLAGLKERHIGTDGVDDPGNFMAGNARILDAGPMTQLGKRIAMADAAGLNANANVAGAGIGKLLLDEFECSAGGGDLHGTTSDYGHSGEFLLWLVR